MTLGGRYSYEKKVFNTFGRGLVPPDGPIIPIPGYPFVRDADTQSWDAFTPKFGIDYSFSDDVLAYFSVTRGFKSGGYNITGTEPAYNPETIWAYEVGLKATLFDGLAQFDASAFYYDYNNLQVQSFTPQGTLDITNAASSTIKGVELEIRAEPTDNFQLFFAVSFLDAAYDDYITARSTAPDVPLDLSGNRLNFAPRWMFNIGSEYDFELGGGYTAAIQLEFRWQSRSFFSAFNDMAYSQGSYGLLNAQIRVLTPNEQIELSVYGRNLTDEDYTVGMYDFSATGTSKFITEPRVIGVRLRFDY